MLIVSKILIAVQVRDNYSAIVIGGVIVILYLIKGWYCVI